MKRFLTISLFLLLCAGRTYGQTPVTVTGTIYAPNGALATSGYVSFTIVPTSGAIQYFVQGVGVISPQTATCGINGVGLVKNTALTGACTIWGNDVISPGNTTYTVTYAPANVINTRVARISITGSTFNLNAPVFAPVVQIVPQYQTITTSPIAVNLIPVADSVFNVGQSNHYYAAGYFRNLFVDTCSGCGLISSGNLPPLFTTSIAGNALTFALSNAAANMVFGRCTGSLGAPSYCSITQAMLPFTLPLSLANGGTGLTAVPGASTNIIYNSASAYGASQDLTWDNTTKTFSVKTAGSVFLRMMLDAGAATLRFAATAPYIRDNTGTGWFFTSQGSQSFNFGPTSDPATYIFGVGGTTTRGTVQLGNGSAKTVLEMNDGSGGAGVWVGATILIGTEADPNGVYVANPGSLFITTAGGAGATLWVKETLTTNMGWVAK